MHASVAFFSSRDVCAKAFVSLQECASRALFSLHARHPLPPVTGVLSDQFVLGGEVDFPAQVGDRHCGRRPGAAISGFAPQETAMQIERSVTR